MSIYDEVQAMPPTPDSPTPSPPTCEELEELLCPYIIECGVRELIDDIKASIRRKILSKDYTKQSDSISVADKIIRSDDYNSSRVLVKLPKEAKQYYNFYLELDGEYSYALKVLCRNQFKSEKYGMSFDQDDIDTKWPRLLVGYDILRVKKTVSRFWGTSYHEISFGTCVYKFVDILNKELLGNKYFDEKEAITVRCQLYANGKPINNSITAGLNDKPNPYICFEYNYTCQIEDKVR